MSYFRIVAAFLLLFMSSFSFQFLGFQFFGADCHAMPPNEQAMLKRAITEGNFKVKVLEKIHEGHTQTIVVLGETHIMTEKRSQLSKEIINTFEDIGIEGIFDGSLASASKDIEFSYWLSSFIYPGAGKFPGAIHQVLTKEVYQKAYESFLSDYPNNRESYEEAQDKVPPRDSPELQELYESIGLPRTFRLNSATLLRFYLATKTHFRYPRRIFKLEALEPVPGEVKEFADSFHNYMQSYKTVCGVSALSAVTLAVGQKSISTQARNCIYGVAGAVQEMKIQLS